MRHSWGFGLALAVTGCATVHARADAAYEHGDYMQAAALYDEALADDPNDSGARAGRDRARNAALRGLLDEAQADWRAGHDEVATGTLERVLELRAGWKIELPPAALADEVAAARAHVAKAIGAVVASPLVAERVAARYHKLFAYSEFAPAAADARDAIAASGKRVCDRLPTDDASPYWTWLVARYCAHFGVARAPVALPHTHPALDVDGNVVGDAQLAKLRDALASAFRDSVWYAPAGDPVAASVSGHVGVAYDTKPVALAVDWVEKVSYTENVTTRESYQEPYIDTETYTESVPTTQYSTCGTTTCTQTVYTTQMRTRTVTKYRTAWRDVTTPVTKHRDEPRTFHYDATEHRGRYVDAIEVRVDALDVTARIDADFTIRANKHDVTFVPAGVSPQRGDLESLDAFAAHEHARLADALREQLDARYAAVRCVKPAYTRDDAASCAYLDARKLPAPARAVLREVFGADEPYLAATLTR